MGADLPTRWQAEWVWFGETGVRVGALEGERDPEVVDRFVLLRRAFELEARPAHALIEGGRELPPGCVGERRGGRPWTRSQRP